MILPRIVVVVICCLCPHANATEHPVQILGFEEHWDKKFYKTGKAVFSLRSTKKNKRTCDYLDTARKGKADRFKLGSGLLLIVISKDKTRGFYFPNYTVPENSYKEVSVVKVKGGFKWSLSDLERKKNYMLPAKGNAPPIFRSFWVRQGVFEKK
jgi:hypothetical protein